jgi:hypothetical protein
VFDTEGCSYRFNAYLPADYLNLGLADDPVYNLAGKRESWVPQPSRFIMMHEFAAYPFDNPPVVEIVQWHGCPNPGNTVHVTSSQNIPDQLIAPTLFVDGHVQQCDFTMSIRKNPFRGLEPGKDWNWYKPIR